MKFWKCRQKVISNTILQWIKCTLTRLILCYHIFAFYYAKKIFTLILLKNVGNKYGTNCKCITSLALPAYSNPDMLQANL